MTGRFLSREHPIKPIGAGLTIAMISGCSLVGVPGGMSANLPAEDQTVSGVNEVTESGILGDIREQNTSTEDSIAIEEVLQDSIPDEARVLEIATVLPFGGPPALAEFAKLIAEGVEVAAVELSEDLLDVRITSLDDDCLLYTSPSPRD